MTLVERLRNRVHDAPMPTEHLLDEAAGRIEALEALVVSEREENLWHAYYTGYERDGKWGHMFMSDGEGLAEACGFNPLDGQYDAAAIKAAIPIAARQALEEAK